MSKIANFIAEDNPAAAQRYITRLRERTEVLRAFPESGHRIRKRSNIRALIERPIIIVYAVKDDRIEILRFWHGARGNSKIS
ncbi:MAG: type II toxin-antitoxin system RelE/ParE family toxin [Verrucomicrobia bacterium]|nr:type II toxin-antitoxin system RelE/ParE family toxin [Verrucomicrobiota bacterium]